MPKFFDYSRPGKGISKDVAKKNKFGLYFEILWEKLWQLCVLNMMLTLLLVPFVALSVGLYYLLGNVPAFTLSVNIQLRIIVSGLPLAFSGPLIAAAFKIVRDYVRREPVFIFIDFFICIKKNIKQPIVISIFSYLTLSSFSYALPSYFLTQGFVRYILFPLALVAALVVLFMHYYLYLMAVTLDLNIKQLFKNALIFSFISFIKNLLITLIGIIILATSIVMFMLGLSMTFLMGVLMMFWGCLFIALFMYSVSFIAFPEIKRLAIDPYYQNHPEQTSDALVNAEQNSNNDNSDKNTPDLPEYVYHNGRMVHRSVLENQSIFDDNSVLSPKDNKDD